jgi:hypothetical protein
VNPRLRNQLHHMATDIIELHCEKTHTLCDETILLDLIRSIHRMRSVDRFTDLVLF